MANITNKIAEYKALLDKLKDEMQTAIDKEDQEAIDKIGNEIKETEKELDKYNLYPTKEDIDIGNFPKDPKTPNALNSGQINYHDLTSREASNFPVITLSQDGKVIEETLYKALQRQNTNDLADTIEGWTFSHGDARDMYDAVRAATKFVAVNDSVASDYGWLSPIYIPYVFLSESKHVHDVGVTPSEYEDDKYFPNEMLCGKGFDLEINGKSAKEGKDYQFGKDGEMNVGGITVIRSFQFLGGYVPGAGDQIFCSGYRIIADSDSLGEEIKNVKNHTEVVEESFNTFESENLETESNLSNFISDQGEIKTEHEASIAKLLSEEIQALDQMDIAFTESEARQFRIAARVKLKASISPSNGVEQVNAEIANAEAETSQLVSILTEATTDKDVWNNTADDLTKELEKIRSEIDKYYAPEEDPNSDGDDGDEVGPM